MTFYIFWVDFTRFYLPSDAINMLYLALTAMLGAVSSKPEQSKGEGRWTNVDGAGITKRRVRSAMIVPLDPKMNGETTDSEKDSTKMGSLIRKNK